MNLYFYLVISTSCLLLGHLMRGERWKLILKRYFVARTSTYYAALSLGYASNIILPFKIGELIRAIALARTNSKSFSIVFASIILERLIDLTTIIAISLPLIKVLAISRSTILGLIAFATILWLFIFLLITKNQIMFKVIYHLSGLFNERLSFSIRNFFWSLYSLTRASSSLARSLRFYFYTIVMWFFYGLALAGLLETLSLASADLVPNQIFEFLYLGNLSLSNLASLSRIVSFDSQAFWIIIAFITSPLALILIYILVNTIFSSKPMIRLSTIIPQFNWHFSSDSLLSPQIFEDQADQKSFVNDFLTGTDSKLFTDFCSRANLVVLKDISSGSGAQTWVIRDQYSEKIRKFAFSKQANGLKVQSEWLKANAARLPVTKILGFEEFDYGFSYDMPYSPTFVSFFEIIHTLPVSISGQLLLNILNKLDTGLYTNRRIANRSEVVQYFLVKFSENVRLMQVNFPPHLTSSQKIMINGQQYRNLPFFLENDIATILCNDIKHLDVCEIHGDLTIENIIVDTTLINSTADCWYLIDPNPENIFNSPLIDIAKLFQSLNMGYEFLGKVRLHDTNVGELRFQVLNSQQYQYLISLLVNELGGDSSTKRQDVAIHEIVNYARLIPYKLKKVPHSAPIFYGTMLILLNRYWDTYHEGN